MSRLIVLDAGPLGLLTRSPRVHEAQQCADWLNALLAAGPDDLLAVATTNVGHLGRLVPAQRWDEIM